MTLTLAATPYRHPARKVTAMRELVGYSEPRFWQVVGRLLDDPAAEAALPAEVRRLRRLRDRRRASRAA